MEIKSEVSEILALTSEIRQITIDTILLLLSETFGLSEIKAEVSAIERAVFSSTFGLQEIKSEVSEILSIISNLNIEFPTTLLSDIKSEVSAIESAVFNPTFGLLEIKSEVSLLLSEFEDFLGSRGPAQNLTTGPFLQTAAENNMEVKAYNATGTLQSVTFTVRAIDNDSPCPGGTILATAALINIPSCCARSEELNISDNSGNIIVNAQTSATFGLFLYAATISEGGGTKFTEFFSADFLPLGTICAG